MLIVWEIKINMGNQVVKVPTNQLEIIWDTMLISMEEITNTIKITYVIMVWRIKRSEYERTKQILVQFSRVCKSEHEYEIPTV